MVLYPPIPTPPLKMTFFPILGTLTTVGPCIYHCPFGLTLCPYIYINFGIKIDLRKL